MKKLPRIIIGLTPITVGVIFVSASVNAALTGAVFFSWVSSGLFGISLIAAGVAIALGVKLEDIFTNYM
jgi:hypothetical protein